MCSGGTCPAGTSPAHLHKSPAGPSPQSSHGGRRRLETGTRRRMHATRWARSFEPDAVCMGVRLVDGLFSGCAHMARMQQGCYVLGCTALAWRSVGCTHVLFCQRGVVSISCFSIPGSMFVLSFPVAAQGVLSFLLCASSYGADANRPCRGEVLQPELTRGSSRCRQGLASCICPGFCACLRVLSLCVRAATYSCFNVCFSCLKAHSVCAAADCAIIRCGFKPNLRCVGAF